LLDRISEHNPLPLRKRLALPSFQKSPIDAEATLEVRIKATRKRFLALFDRRALFDNLSPLVKDHLHQLASYLEWIEANSKIIATCFHPAAQSTIFLGLTECANIRCTKLADNYTRIADQFDGILVAGYFDICKDASHWPENNKQ
jgi:hypothetical protein